jgi:CHAD domain-containing protein
MPSIHNPPQSMRTFALQQARTLLRRLAYQVSRASRPGDPRVVDDLREAVGRFNRCLRLFGQFLPAGKSKKVHRELKEVLDLAAAVRDCDMALELLEEARMPAGSNGSKLFVTLSRERKEADTRLRTGVRRLVRRSFSQKWRAGLRL